MPPRATRALNSQGYYFFWCLDDGSLAFCSKGVIGLSSGLVSPCAVWMWNIIILEELTPIRIEMVPHRMKYWFVMTLHSKRTSEQDHTNKLKYPPQHDRATRSHWTLLHLITIGPDLNSGVTLALFVLKPSPLQRLHKWTLFQSHLDLFLLPSGSKISIIIIQAT